MCLNAFFEAVKPMVRITKFKYFFEGNSRMKHRGVEGVTFTIAVIKGVLGFVRPTFCTLEPVWALHLLWRQQDKATSIFGLNMVPLTPLRHIAQCTRKWGWQPPCPSCYQVPCWMLLSPQLDSLREPEFTIGWGWKCPWRYFRATARCEISNIWQRGGQVAGGRTSWCCNSKRHQKTLVRTMKLLSTALVFHRDLTASAWYIDKPFALFSPHKSVVKRPSPKWEQEAKWLMLVQWKHNEISGSVIFSRLKLCSQSTTPPHHCHALHPLKPQWSVSQQQPGTLCGAHLLHKWHHSVLQDVSCFYITLL